MEFIRKSSQPVLTVREYTLKEGVRLPVLQFPLLDSTGIAEHFFTTRLGGVSEGFLSSLNLCTTKGDDPAHLSHNYSRIAEALQIDPDRITLGCQVHGTDVAHVREEDAGAGLTQPRKWTSADGLVTNVPGLALGILVADCVPILFVDPVHHAVGACHSGWRGTVGRIGAKTIRRMQEEFGTAPSDLLAGIGPSICQDHYEVSQEVADRFREEFHGQEEVLLRYDGNPGHWQLNLWEACRITLLEAGMRPENIAVTDICTACNPDLLFSHRMSHGRRGNLGAFILLREPSA